jgi:hypothetical protein
MKKLIISLLMIFISYAAVADCQADLNNIQQTIVANGQLSTQTNIIVISMPGSIDMTPSFSCVANCTVKANTSIIKARCTWSEGEWNETLLAY